MSFGALLDFSLLIICFHFTSVSVLPLFFLHVLKASQKSGAVLYVCLMCLSNQVNLVLTNHCCNLTVMLILSAFVVVCLLAYCSFDVLYVWCMSSVRFQIFSKSDFRCFVPIMFTDGLVYPMGNSWFVYAALDQTAKLCPLLSLRKLALLSISVVQRRWGDPWPD